METTGYVINMAKNLMSQYPSIDKVMIKVDDTGVGGGVTDRLEELIEDKHYPFEVFGVNNGSTSEDDFTII